MKKLIVLQIEVSPDSYLPIETFEGDELELAYKLATTLGFVPHDPAIKANTENSEHFIDNNGKLAVITQWELPQELCQLSN